MAGARWVQHELLEQYPDAQLEVYAVWFDMFVTDSRGGWPGDLLTDARVQHFWDENKLVGQWYGENVTQKAPDHIEWDAYFLYGPEAEWSKPSGLISWGRTIVASRSQLQADLASLLRK